VWIRFNGGNLRDWQLMSATTTRRTPRQLRFVEQDVDLPPPFTLGDATGGGGIPYAAGNEVVLLGANGAAVFKHVAPARVLAVTGGRGPAGAVVAARLATGDVELLRSDGSVAQVSRRRRGGAEDRPGAGRLVAQVPGVEIRSGTRTTVVHLPAGAVMLTAPRPHPLHEDGGLHAYRSGGQDTLCCSRAKRASGATYDTHRLGWARGQAVSRVRRLRRIRD
jgi:hypothetical protein